jgi:tripartite-type tricarboxylate transporter receptor subunit TctC
MSYLTLTFCRGRKFHWKIFAFSLLTALVASGSALAQAQDFPTRPIRFVVAYPPGGSVDYVARLLAHTIAPQLGQPIVVENRAGASGIVGTQAMAAAAGDGHSFLVAATAVMAIVPHLRKVPFVPQRDFIPVARLADTVSLFAANKHIQANNFDELITQAKQENRELRFGYVGVGTITHLMGEIIRNETGVKLLSVPYKGNTDNVNAALSGEIDFIIDPTAISHVKSGALKALAVNAPQRVASLPEVPTIREGQVRITAAPSWISLFAPKATPPSTVERMSALMAAALADPEVQQKLLMGGVSAHYQAPAEFAQQIQKDSLFYAELIRKYEVLAD